MEQPVVVKKRYGKIAVRVAVVVIPLLVLIGALVYTKVAGFKHALQELVDNGTHGEYALKIGATEVHVRTLSFKFDNVRLDRNPWVSANGIRSVKIPSFELQFGSFASLFTEEFSIKRLVVEEPEIELEARSEKKVRTTEKVLLAQHIMGIYNAIESVLTRFNIESLVISKASLNVEQQNQQSLKVSFIDLLIEHWRMRDLSDKSQLKLSIEKQNLTLGKADISFSGIEYNFLKHHLVFTNFHFASADSITGSDIDISGESLLLQNMDFKDFSQNLSYNLQRAEIKRPVIEARLKLKRGRQKKDVDMNMAMRIMKQTIGQCSVDSIVIRDARVHIELQKETDTVRIDLPDVDFRLHNFAMLRQSSDVQLGEMEINLNGSEITLSRSLSVRLDEVLYDRNHDLTLRNLTLLNSSAHLPIATLSSMKVRYLSLPTLIFYSRIHARSITAQGGILNIGTFTPNARAKDTVVHLGGVLINDINLKNISVNYTDRKQQLSVEDLSLWAANVRMGSEGKMNYVLKNIRARKVHYSNPIQKLIAQIEDASFNGQNIRAAHANILKDSLTIRLADVDAETRNNLEDGLADWRSVEIGNANITGRLPIRQPPTSHHNSNKKSSLGHLMIESLAISVADKQSTLTLRGNNLDLEKIELDASFKMPERMSGQLQEIAFIRKDFTTHSTGITINYPDEVAIGDFRLDADRMGFTAKGLQINTISHVDDAWDFKNVRGNGLIVTSRQQNFITSDSLSVKGVQLKSTYDPIIEQVEIFNPRIKLTKQKREHKEEKPREHHRRFIPQHIIIHPGELELNDGQKIYFGTWVANKAKGSLKGTSLSTSLKKMDLKATNITILDHEVSMDSLKLTSNKNWYRSNTIEESQIDGTFRNLNIKGLSLNSFLKTNKAKSLNIAMDNMALQIFRDKRQTDPPMTAKPSTLDGMIPMSDKFQVSTLRISDGKIEFTQISDKTGEKGYVLLNKLNADLVMDSLSSLLSLRAKTNLYNSGTVDLDYQTVDKSRFKLKVNVKDLDLTKLNQIVMPLQSLKIKSGYLKDYSMTIDADDEQATGNAMISYKGLHLEIFKHNEPERKNLGSEVLTLLADGIILKHSKDNATSDVTHVRVKHKTVFHYWVTSTIHGAIGAVRKGKKKKI